MIISKKDFEELRSKMNLSNLYHNKGKEFMWWNALYLGPFIDSEAVQYDVGIKRRSTLIPCFRRYS